MAYGGDYWNLTSMASTEEKVLNPAVNRIIRSMMDTGVFDDKTLPKDVIKANVSTPENKKIARELNEASIVLLKNDKGTLPLNLN
jgi:beta-glucosidase